MPKFSTFDFIVIVIVFLSIKSCIFGDDKPKTEVKTDPVEYAAGMCQEFIKERLNDPDGAEFEPTYNAVVSSVGNNEYKVFYPLRARNGFNALRKATFVCYMRLDGDNWKSIDVSELKVN